MSISDLLDSVKARSAKWGEVLEPCASREEILNVRKRVLEKFDVVLPEEYLDFLRLVNGLEFNGLLIYGTKNSTTDAGASPLDLVEMNDIARENVNFNLSTLIVVGEDSTGLLTYDPIKKAFQYRDRIGIDRVINFACFEELLIAELAKTL
jgi:hypothetical protein